MSDNIKRMYHIIVVGTGGTGGNLVRDLGRFLKFYDKDNTAWDLTLIDGDHVEEKNAERQPFVGCDVMQNKAVVMRSGLVECFDLPDKKIIAIPEYIESTQDFRNLYKYFSKPSWTTSQTENVIDMVILVGAVDNHRARQVMHEFFYMTDNIIYLDSANEFTNGEVVVGVRLGGVDIAPPRGYYFEDILTDRSPSASELSCGVVNVSAPQHIATNQCAANHCLAFIAEHMQENKIKGGIVFFDAFKHYSRFERWNYEENGAPCKEEVMPHD